MNPTGILKAHPRRNGDSMRAKTLRLLGAHAVLAALAACTTGGSTTTGYPEVECGEGTEERNGTCVAIVDPSTVCGEGTVFDPMAGECIPRVECGENTTFNPDAGTCEPDQVCGPGTVLDVATGTCRPEADCGDGTRLDEDAGVCVPVASCGPGTVFNADAGACERIDQCGTGTVFNPDAGACEFILECGPDQVEIDGVCYRAGDDLAQQADVRENRTDNNDPALMGTPEALPLEPLGMRTIFTGTIIRPFDAQGDGVLVQDRDVWRFTGTAGQALRIRVVSAGLPLPAFELRGPDGYFRRSAFNAGVDADRHVVLPADGTYDLTVVPTVFLATGQPVGSSEAAYVGIIEEVMLNPTMLVPGTDVLMPESVQGQLRDFSTSVLQLQTGDNTPVLFNFSQVDPGITPAILVFRASDMALISHVVLDNLATRSWVATLVADASDAIVVLDWRDASGAADAYTLQHMEIPLTEVGPLREGTRVTTPTGIVSGRAGRTYTFTVTVDGVYELEIGQLSGTSSSWQIDSAGGTRQLVTRDDAFITVLPAGEYTVHFYNSSTSDSPENLLVTSMPTRDVGTLSVSQMGSVTVEGTPLTYAYGDWLNGYIVARVDEDGLLALEVTAPSGTADLLVTDGSGNELREVDRVTFGRAVHIPVKGGETYFMELEPDGEPGLTQWTATVTALPIPDAVEMEPNDVYDTATVLPALPVTLYGALEAKDGSTIASDVFELTLDAPLQANQAVEIRFDNLTGDSTSVTTQAANVNVLDGAFNQVRSIPVTVGDSPGVLSNSGVTLLGGYEGAGPFYVRVDGENITRDTNYVLRVRVVDVALEQEPNDATTSATALGMLPVHGAGYIDETDRDVADHFSFTLSDDASTANPVRVLLRNMETNTDLKVSVLDGAGTEVMTAENEPIYDILLPTLTAGTYLLKVENDGNGSDIAPLYTFTIETMALSEVEPNDDALSATPLGALTPDMPLNASGLVFSGELDVFHFTLPTPLAADQGVMIRVNHFNYTTSKLLVKLYDGDDPASATEVATDNNYVTTLVSSALTGTGPFAITVAGGSLSTGLTEVPLRYSLEVKLADAAEKEPNGTTETATLLGSLPARVLGGAEGNSNSSSGVPELDFYKLELPQPLAAGEVLRVTAENLIDTSDMQVKLYGADGVTELVASPTDFEIASVLSPPGTTDTTFYVVVDGRETVVGENDLYELRVEITDAQ